MTSQVHIYLLAISLTQVGLIEFVDLDGYSQQEWSRQVHSDWMVTYERNLDRSRIELMCWGVPLTQDLEKEWDRQTLASKGARERETTPASGIPLGDALVLLRFPSGAVILSRVDRSIVHLRLRYEKVLTPSGQSYLASDRAGDIERIEGGARHAVARLKAKEFLPGPSVTVNGRVIPSTLRDGSGKVYVGLDGWAHARNIALNKNVRRGTYAFVHSGQNYVGGLGTDQIKVGANWRSMQSMAVRKGDAWYVPLEGIEGTLR